MPSYYIAQSGQQQGPYTAEQLAVVSPETLVWCEGWPEWVPAGRVPGLVKAPPVPHVGYAHTYPPPAPTSHYAQPAANNGNKIAAGIFGILLGGLGIHKFMLGFTGPGLIMLLVSVLTCGWGYLVVGVIGFIEGIIYLTKSDAEFHQTYVVEKRQWF